VGSFKQESNFPFLLTGMCHGEIRLSFRYDSFIRSHSFQKLNIKTQQHITMSTAGGSE